MSVLDTILGRPLGLWERATQALSVITGVPGLGLGALASTGYGPEAALTILVTTGVMGLRYFPIIIVAIVLTYSAQTSFADFPRVCRLLAEDSFLPSAFAERGRRLVFSVGIIVLAVLSGIILIAFGGVTERLIPLFAIGAFSVFLFSQVGMVVYWLRKRGEKIPIGLVYNALGAVATGVALLVMIVAKFTEGAWVTIVVALGLALLLQRIKRHYKRVAREIDRPLELQTSKLRPPVVIIPIDGWDRVAERALRFGLLLSDDVTAVHAGIDNDNSHELMETWSKKVEKPAKDADAAIPQLVVIYSPYRQISQPILEFVKKVRKEKPDRLIAVIIPELVAPHWYEYFLHNVHAAGLRALLFLEHDRRTVVISTPWYMRD